MCSTSPEWTPSRSLSRTILLRPRSTRRSHTPPSGPATPNGFSVRYPVATDTFLGTRCANSILSAIVYSLLTTLWRPCPFPRSRPRTPTRAGQFSRRWPTRSFHWEVLSDTTTNSSASFGASTTYSIRFFAPSSDVELVRLISGLSRTSIRMDLPKGRLGSRRECLPLSSKTCAPTLGALFLRLSALLHNTH